MFEMLLLYSSIAALAFASGVFFNDKDLVGKIGLALTAFFVLLASFLATNSATTCAVNMYKQGKPVSDYQARLVLKHKDYSTDIPIILKKD